MGACLGKGPMDNRPIAGEKEYPWVATENRVSNFWDVWEEKDIEVMGTGASCRVLKAHKKSEAGPFFAVKEMIRNDEWNPKLFKTEHDILIRLKHPNVLKYVDSWIDRKYFYVINELCTGGELFEKIHTKKRFREKDAAAILIDIIGAIEFCHSQNVVHRDLKPENIVYRKFPDGKEQLVIIDFGDAKIVEDKQQYNEFVGTAFYLPPEIIRNRYGWELKASDMWSIGIIAYVLMTGRPPFHGKSHKEILKNILKQELKFPRRITLSGTAKNFVRSLCEKKTKKRKTAKEALQHEFLGGKASTANLGSEFFTNLASYHQSCLLKRVLVKLGTEMLSHRRKELLVQAFNLMDRNSDGYIDRKELATYLASLGMQSDLAYKSADSIIKELGSPKKKKIEMRGFREGAVSFDLGTQSQIRKTFKQMAGENSHVTIENLNEYFHQRVEMSSLQTMLEEIDLDKDGKISFEEFQKAMDSPLECARTIKEYTKKKKKKSGDPDNINVTAE